jgi:hypothetical protein
MAIPTRSRSKAKTPTNDSPLYVPPKPLPPDWLEFVKEQERRQDRNSNPLPDPTRPSEGQ